MTPDGERNAALLLQVQSGGEEALDAIVRENMGLVKMIALRYKDRGAEYEDLVQIGCIGLIKAARCYDFSFGTAFSTYAVPLISGEIRRHLRDDGPVKVPRAVKKLGADAMRARERIKSEEGREPRLSELCALLGCGEEELAQALGAAGPVRSLYESARGDEDGRLLDLLPDPDERLETLTDRLALRQAIARLDEFDRKLVFLRYYKDLSQDQTGRILGVSQVKISREEKKIMGELRRFLESG